MSPMPPNRPAPAMLDAPAISFAETDAGEIMLPYTLQDSLDAPLKQRDFTTRRLWRSFAQISTFFVFDCCIGGSKEAKQAWREKIAICVIVLLTSALVVGTFGFLPLFICPDEPIYTYQDVWERNNAAWSAIHGAWYDMDAFISHHPGGERSILPFLGRDASRVFPRLPKELLPHSCLNAERVPSNATVSQPICQDLTKADLLSGIPCHDTVIGRNFTSAMRPYFKGQLAFSGSDLLDSAGAIFWVYGRVYNVTHYIESLKNPLNYRIEADSPNAFLESSLNDFVINAVGQDATDIYANLYPGNETLACLDALFFVGIQDQRFNLTCSALNIGVYAMLAVVGLILVVKFITAIFSIGRHGNIDCASEDVIALITAYTEGSSELEKTINSIAVSEYPDDHKCLFIVVDGKVRGYGNDLTTADIVLKIFGRSSDEGQPLLGYVSLGDNRQNYGIIYDGIYDIEGHKVKYVIVIKNENRGKRDSQCLLYKFLNRAQTGKIQSPLDMGLNRAFGHFVGADYLLSVDADTKVEPDALAYMVNAMETDERVLALCGETKVGNKTASWVTMIQVFEYFINFFLNKVFESTFGTVSCLPGCFSLYRLKNRKNKKLFLIADQLVQRYASNIVDTLHLKNLLGLGEDRYLTTLLLNFFPAMRLVFVPEALCFTIVPDSLSVLFSQRRRWINSTLHNLVELLRVPTMCGCSIFSMRTIVFFDLLSTLILPASVVYLAYLVYVFVSQGIAVSMMLIVTFGVMFGLQVLIFVLKSEWQYLWWFIVFMVLGVPIFYFFLPVYSFWHSDQVSWGKTRKVA